MVNKPSPQSEKAVRAACKLFFVGLHLADLHDHPQVFNILDDVARENGYMISCEQRGISGTILKFTLINEGG